jgi:hypothetical protein
VSEDDRKLTEELLCAAIVRLRAMFGADRVDRALHGIDCVVHLHGKPTTTVTESWAEVTTGRRDQQYTATISILAPEGFSAAYRDVAGFAAGREHHGKVLAHEYAAILLDRIAAEKPAGWRFFDGPAWFVQGYEEYLGVALLDAPKRDEALATFVRAQADPDRVRFHPQAQKPTFDEALPVALGVPLKEVEARWKSWREEALARQDWRKAVVAAKSPKEIAAAVAGLDLRSLGEESRDKVFDALRTLAGKDVYWRREQDGTPHRLYRVNCGAAKWALVVSYPGFEVPGFSWIAVHLFDGEWKQTAVDNFPTGYRISLFDVWQERVDSLPEPAIVVRLGTIGSFGNFTYRQRQYYAVRDGRIALVRLEQEGKDMGRGSFAASHPWTGPKPPLRSAAQWIDLLGSEDPADVLESLTWLAGSHMATTEQRSPDVNQESLEDSRLWEAVRDDPRTKQKLAALAKSTNRWVREAAVLAATPETERR